MSSTTWTRDALLSSAVRLAGVCWRVVESQSRGSTLKLTDTLDEQLALERIIEATKPPVPAAARDLHYLLFTPFRYSPYPVSSRFRRAGLSAGVFYGSEHSETAIAETAFHRLMFFFESPNTPWPKNAFDFRAFAAEFETARGADLTCPPLASQRAQWTDPADYTSCLSFADAARDAGLQAIRYQSVRDPQGARQPCPARCRRVDAGAEIHRGDLDPALQRHGRTCHLRKPAPLAGVRPHHVCIGSAKRELALGAVIAHG